MNRFIARLLSPEIARLQADLAQVTRERDWYKALAEKGDEAAVQFAAERELNRKRETALLNKIIAQVAKDTSPLPDRAEPVQQTLFEDKANTPRGLTEDEKNLLWERAKEYLLQKGASPEEMNEAGIQMVFDNMLRDDAGYWLSN